MKKILLLSNFLTIALLVAVVIGFHIPQKISSRFFDQKKNVDTAGPYCNYALKYFDFHYKHETDSPKIIMFGNSIMRHGNWTALLQRNDIINRGIDGDNLTCMCDRLKYLKGKNAKIWFIEGGINDLFAGGHIQTLFGQYKTLLSFIKSEKAIPVISLPTLISPMADKTYPGRKSDYKATNRMIRQLNEQLVKYANENGISYIDLNTVTSGQTESLKDEYTSDGVHLNEKGYREWSLMIEHVLKLNRI